MKKLLLINITKTKMEMEEIKNVEIYQEDLIDGERWLSYKVNGKPKFKKLNNDTIITELA